LQVAYYTNSSSCGGAASYYHVFALSACSSNSCNDGNLGGGIISSQISCQSTATSGLPSGTYVALGTFSAAGCAFVSVQSADFYQTGACIATGSGSQMYSCSSNVPSLTTYSDAACTNVNSTVSTSCTSTQAVDLYSGSVCVSVSPSSQLTVSVFGVIATVIIALVANML
jgi:hypothetical protein